MLPWEEGTTITTTKKKRGFFLANFSVDDQNHLITYKFSMQHLKIYIYVI